MLDLQDPPTIEEQGEERVDVFTLNGTTYSIPKKPRVRWGLYYLNLIRNEGSDVAVSWLLENCLGKDGYEALLAYEELTPVQLQTVIKACAQTVLGELEGPGKRSR